MLKEIIIKEHACLTQRLSNGQGQHQTFKFQERFKKPDGDSEALDRLLH